MFHASFPNLRLALKLRTIPWRKKVLAMWKTREWVTFSCLLHVVLRHLSVTMTGEWNRQPDEVKVEDSAPWYHVVSTQRLY